VKQLNEKTLHHVQYSSCQIRDGSIFDAMFHPPPTNESQKERKLKVYIFFIHKDLLFFYFFSEIENIYIKEKRKERRRRHT